MVLRPRDAEQVFELDLGCGLRPGGRFTEYPESGECTGGLGASIAIQAQRRGNNGSSGLRPVLMPTAIQRREIYV